MSIAVMVPSRGRPESIVRLAEAFRATVVLPDTSLIVAVDDDDPTILRYSQTRPDNVELVIGPRRRLGSTLNWLSAKLIDDHQPAVLAFLGDDHLPRTHGWDAAIREKLLGQSGVAYGNDLVHGEGLPTAAFISAGIVERMGYFNPPGLVHLFLDDYWKMLGHATALHYLPDVVIEHLHPIAGKAEWDPTYVSANASMETDRAEFVRYCGEDWPTERLKLRSF